ncbi:hypothetical protein BKA69DRAFT_544395 [Paraphysoderma sedebokerense]|nr:hypothetical protein BKA69DRAFT_544395 [Paraphysoderma sedebokerense]
MMNASDQISFAPPPPLIHHHSHHSHNHNLHPQNHQNHPQDPYKLAHFDSSLHLPSSFFPQQHLNTNPTSAAVEPRDAPYHIQPHMYPIEQQPKPFRQQIDPSQNISSATPPDSTPRSNGSEPNTPPSHAYNNHNHNNNKNSNSQSDQDRSLQEKFFASIHHLAESNRITGFSISSRSRVFDIANRQSNILQSLISSVEDHIVREDHTAALVEHSKIQHRTLFQANSISNGKRLNLDKNGPHAPTPTEKVSDFVAFVDNYVAALNEQSCFDSISGVSGDWRSNLTDPAIIKQVNMLRFKYCRYLTSMSSMLRAQYLERRRSIESYHNLFPILQPSIRGTTLSPSTAVLSLDAEFARQFEKLAWKMQTYVVLRLQQLSNAVSGIGNDDDDENGLNKHRRFNSNVVASLRASFLQCAYPSDEEKQRLSNCTGLSLKQISVWFTNMRSRTKRNITDCTTDHMPPQPGSPTGSSMSGMPPSHNSHPMQQNQHPLDRRNSSNSDFYNTHDHNTSHSQHHQELPMPLTNTSYFDTQHVPTSSSSSHPIVSNYYTNSYISTTDHRANQFNETYLGVHGHGQYESYGNGVNPSTREKQVFAQEWLSSTEFYESNGISRQFTLCR